MPFKSAKQRKFLFAKKPKVAKQLAKHAKPTKGIKGKSKSSK